MVVSEPGLRRVTNTRLIDHDGTVNHGNFLLHSDGNYSLSNGDEDVMDLISKVEAPILDATADIYQSSNKKTEIIGEDIDDYIEYLSENVSENVGIPTGFSHHPST